MPRPSHDNPHSPTPIFLGGRNARLGRGHNAAARDSWQSQDRSGVASTIGLLSLCWSNSLVFIGKVIGRSNGSIKPEITLITLGYVS